jgi:hypothetical protein
MSLNKLHTNISPVPNSGMTATPLSLAINVEACHFVCHYFFEKYTTFLKIVDNRLTVLEFFLRPDVAHGPPLGSHERMICVKRINANKGINFTMQGRLLGELCS